MARALWKGAISFGLIYVPVELHTASRDNTLPLHMLDSRDFAPVGYHRVNKNTGKEVDWSHIVKGYEYKKGEFVALADADFKHANVKASETIEIDTFCDVAQIPAMYYDKPYYLAPSKGGDKVYSLLRQALEATDKVAVATFVMHQRQHLCAIAPHDSSLMLLTLRFADEVLPAETKPAGKIVQRSSRWRCLNTTRALLGEEPVEVSATIHSPDDARFREVESTVSFTLRFPSGMIANCSSSYSMHEHRNFRVLGSTTVAEIANAFGYEGQKLELSRRDGSAEAKVELSLGVKNQFSLEMDHMAVCVRNNIRPRTPGEEGLQ